MKPKPFLQRGALMALLLEQGLAKDYVEKLLRDDIIPAHRFPGLKKQPTRKHYYLPTVETVLGVQLKTPTP